MAVYSSNILITFGMLVDTDLGLLRIVKQKYNDPSVFNNTILNYDENILKGLLQENEFKNPLMIIMNDKDLVQAESFYQEFLSLEYINIVKASSPTTMVDVVKKFIDSESGMKINILCSTKLEASIISNIMRDCDPSLYNIIIQSEWEDVDISLNDTIFIKYIDQLLELNNIAGKNLMVSDARFNLDLKKYDDKKKTVKEEFALLYGSDNEFYIVSIYYYDETYYLN